MKFWEDIQNLVRRKKYDKKGTVDVDDDPAADAAADAAEDQAILEENKNLSKVRMTDGERDKTLGINKKLVNLALIFVVVIVIVAFLYKAMGHEEGASSKSPQQTTQQEQASKNPQQQDGQLDYKNPNVMKLAQAEQNAKGKNPGVTAQKVAPSTQQPAASADSPAPRSTPATVPAIRSASVPASYSAPYVLPSAAAPSYASSMPAPVQAVRSTSSSTGGGGDNASSQEEKSLADRFKSAIAFALGDTTAAQDSSTDVASASSSSGSDNGGFSYSAPSSDVLQAGTVIPVMLYSGINTDTAGQVTAQVESDVYDTATGSNLLIPAGSRIIGSYESGANESGRVNVTFSTIVLPDGGSYSVGSSMVAVDGQGYNGIQGNLHRHSAQKIGNGLLNAAFTALSTISVDRVTLGQDTFNNLTSNNDVKPTITVDPGYEFNIYVTQPIAFSI
ncbi:TrbI/VirB10 family protein [Mitsuokella multacida]|uniref:TrbI/VirB10 family protein n=1 Tax=Mitsuokella multacida TaxID=52226 RepID=UPI00242AD12F|nr:TrbI/VirB10 family protein [Mitsuokella multacida]